MSAKERIVDLTTQTLTRASRRATPETVSRQAAEETLRTVLGSLDDMKAQDSVTIDLNGKSSIGDYMVVASGTSQRHVASVADRVVKDLERAGRRGLRVEGLRQAEWVLIDAGDVIVHVFRPETRDFYAIEKMWTGKTTGAASQRSG